MPSIRRWGIPPRANGTTTDGRLPGRSCQRQCRMGLSLAEHCSVSRVIAIPLRRCARAGVTAYAHMPRIPALRSRGGTGRAASGSLSFGFKDGCSNLSTTWRGRNRLRVA